MKKRFGKIISFGMAFALSATAYASYMPRQAVFAYEQKEGVVTGSGVNVRSGAGTGNPSLTKLNAGHVVQIIGETMGTDGKIWYQITFTKDGSSISGYMRSDYVQVTSSYTPKNGYVTADDVNVRSGAGTSEKVLTQLNTGHEVKIIGESTASNGALWYRISFTQNGTAMEGYMHSSYVRIGTPPAVTKPTNVVDDPSYEVYLEQQGFPENYRKYLRSLHKLNPQWVFVALPTGLEWSDSVAAESRMGVNLVPSGSIMSYKSLEAGAIDWTTKTWKGFDGAGWVAASKSVIKYYLDPRSFLHGENTMLQFESLQYEPATQTKAGVESIIKGTHMEYGRTVINGAAVDFAQIFIDAGKTYNISPYHLAARAKQETGVNGSNSSYITKEDAYKEFTGYYNFFNIGASPSAEHNAMYNGLTRAKNEGWDSPEKSIIGGAKFLASNYIAKGQNTMYLQKFDVVDYGNGYYAHQYMTNLLAASSEAKLMEKTYSNFQKASITYIVPVYKNMPEQETICPTDNGSPYSVLSDLHINGLGFDQEFDSYITEYSVPIKVSADFIAVEASAYAPNAAIAGTGIYALQEGENKITVSCTGSDGSVRTYNITVVRRPVSEERKKGDVNNDGTIDSLDALEVLRASAQLTQISEQEMRYADINGNGMADAEDAERILKYVTGMIDSL